MDENKNFEYLDLSVGRNREFGQKMPIILPNDTARSFSVKVNEIIFADGSIWKYGGEEWKPLKTAKPLSEILEDYEALKQFKLEYGDQSGFELTEDRDVWICSCGYLNKKDEEKCFNCNTELQKLKDFDVDELNKKRDERLEAEAEAERKRKEEAEKRAKEAAERRERERIEEEKRRAEAERIAAEKKARNIKIAKIVTPIVCAVIAFLIVLNNVIIPNVKYGGSYKEAIELMNSGDIISAYEALIALDGYKDSAEKAEAIYDQYNLEKIKISEVGDYVIFGAYEQDNDTSNGKEEIEWRVLDKQDSRVLVISRYALDAKPYNKTKADVTWESCTLRSWLNSEFINSAFSAEEQALIPTVTVSADKNPEYSTNSGNDVQNKIFLLSITEAKKYFNSDNARQCEPTKYTVANGAYVSSENGNCCWSLRSPGAYQDYASGVNRVGSVYSRGGSAYYAYGGVRPALWIDIG